MNKKVLFLIISLAMLVFGQANASTLTTTATNDSVYDNPEVLPQFKGGQDGMMSFLYEHLQYPKEAKKKGIQGKVYVQFIVRKDGSVTDVAPFKSVHPLLDAEAVRVVKQMPKWIPGKSHGKNVDTSFVLPIEFRVK
ncbi:MAG: energy transducer TonB [Prevotella sp.]|jgi:protein TonB